MEGEERIGLGGAATVLDVPEETVRRLAEEGRLEAERGEDGAYSFRLSEVVELSRELGAEEIFEGGSRHMEEIRKERDAARMEIDRLWSEIERLNLVEFQRELQERTISTLEEEKVKLESERERLIQERLELVEEKSSLVEDRVRLEAELKALKSRGFWARLFGG